MISSKFKPRCLELFLLILVSQVTDSITAKTIMSGTETTAAVFNHTKTPFPTLTPSTMRHSNVTPIRNDSSKLTRSKPKRILPSFTQSKPESKVSSTVLISSWQTTHPRVFFIDDLLEQNIGAAFYDAQIYNYSKFVFLPKQSVIYVVGNKMTILKLDLTTFMLLDSFVIPQQTGGTVDCEESWTCLETTEISLLATMPNEQMVWFCYVHYIQYPNRPSQHAQSACMVPQIENLAEPLVQWENLHFNSMDPHHTASILNAADGFTYISGFAPDHVRIFRAHMPDWNGHINWTGALVTDRSRVYISDIMAAFSGPLMQTNSIRFNRVPTPVPNSFSNICERFNSNNLTREELSIGRHLSLSFPYRYNPIEPLYRRALFTQTGVEWTHLQSYDLPALPTHYHFGNPAKTTIIWLGSKTELTRVVIYELVESSPHENKQRSSHPVVCKLNEYRVGRAMNVLNRPTKFREYQSGNFENNVNRNRKSTGHMNLRIMRSFARRYNKYGSNAEQKEEEIRFVKIVAEKLFIITNQQILWLPISDCSQYRLFEACQESNDPHCGWSWPEGLCVDGYDRKPSLQTNWFNTFSPSVDRRSSGNVQCPSDVVLVDQRESHAWSAWYGCRLMDTGTGRTQVKWTNSNTPLNSFMRFTGICQCRVCLSRAECILGTQEVTNCS
ncbi:hypothetical protein PHET_00446 [Paragonimus heterotremus]|uniref:Sema domain-containing protein n=1 Tax=Paragonimus heterotremus TaxID=100268 RepID=A0A8J4WJV3_9TREM|nr:hypothetical protein PHET_00446 [Paragonimus heterotremus]